MTQTLFLRNLNPQQQYLPQVGITALVHSWSQLEVPKRCPSGSSELHVHSSLSPLYNTSPTHPDQNQLPLQKGQLHLVHWSLKESKILPASIKICFPMKSFHCLQSYKDRNHQVYSESLGLKVTGANTALIIFPSLMCP